MMKAALRSLYREKRRLISPRERSVFTDLVLINFQKINLPFVNCVHTYLAGEDEIDTQQVIRYLAFINPGLRVCIPKVNMLTRQMENFIYEEDMDMVVNMFGIEEPLDGERVEAASIDLVLTPLLIFDRTGNRVGYGKGFYDKFFTECKDDVIKTGLCFFEPTEIIKDTNPFDIPLNYCITPKKVYRF